MVTYLETFKTLVMDDNVNKTDMVPALQDITFSEKLDNMPENKFK